MKLPYHVMGCGLSKSASKAHVGDGQGSRHGDRNDTDAYIKAPTISVEKVPVPDPLTPLLEEMNSLSGGTLDGSRGSGKSLLANGDSLSDASKEHPGTMTSKDNNLSASSVNSPRVSDSQLRSRVSDSQLEFFRMLDDKVEQGGDYGSESEASGAIMT